MSSRSAMKRIAIIVALLMALAPAGALASGDTVIEDCADDGELSRTYSQAEYKQALANLPADLDEYTDCRSTIRRAQLRRATGTGAARNSAGATTTSREKKRTAKDRRKVKEALESRAPLPIGGVVQPASTNSSASIPSPLIVVLALTLLGALGALAIAIRRIVNSRRNR